jgi:hypothetical protein
VCIRSHRRQRVLKVAQVWASSSRRAVVVGGAVGSVLITIAVFLLGFAGWLAFASGLGSWDANPNLYMFEIFKASYWVSRDTHMCGQALLEAPL